MIFDVKMEDFRQKARLVAGGHQTKAPATVTYASVVSCETVHLALTIASLNDLKVKVGEWPLVAESAATHVMPMVEPPTNPRPVVAPTGKMTLSHHLKVNFPFVEPTYLKMML
jgi:hypothetical protein